MARGGANKYEQMAQARDAMAQKLIDALGKAAEVFAKGGGGGSGGGGSGSGGSGSGRGRGTIDALSPDEMRYAAGSPRGPLRGYRGHGDTSGSGDFGADMQGGLPGQIGAGVLGAIPGLLAGAGNYAAGKTPYGTTGTTDMLGQNLEMGLLKGLADAAKPIPVLGEFAQQQFKGLEEAVYAPEQRARGKLSPTFERMAMAGVDVSDKEIQEAFQFAIPQERRGVAMKQRVERIGAAVNAENGSALGGALSQIGL